MFGWFHRLSFTVKIIGFIGVVATALVSVAQAWPYVEPYVYAHRGYVRYYDDEHMHQMLQRVIKVQIEQNRERRQHLLDEVKQRESELQSDPAGQFPQYKAMLQERVDWMKSNLKKLDQEDEALFKEQGIRPDEVTSPGSKTVQ
jgi:hypothetical protein